jgi:hypothetical protein
MIRRCRRLANRDQDGVVGQCRFARDPGEMRNTR